MCYVYNIMNIEEGIPFSPGKKGWARQLRSMTVGSSVVMPNAISMKSFIQTVRYCGFTHTSRKLEDGSYRIWKTGIRKLDSDLLIQDVLKLTPALCEAVTNFCDGEKITDREEAIRQLVIDGLTYRGYDPYGSGDES